MQEGEVWYRFRHLLWCRVASKSQRARTAEGQRPPPPSGSQLGPTAAPGPLTVLGSSEAGGVWAESRQDSLPWTVGPWGSPNTPLPVLLSGLLWPGRAAQEAFRALQAMPRRPSLAPGCHTWS